VDTVPRWRRTRGAAAVELALVLVPLLVIVLGTIDWGYYFMVRQVATNAAREGARAAALGANNALAVATAHVNGQGVSSVTCATSFCGGGGACPVPVTAGANVCVRVRCTVPNATRFSITRFLPAGLIPADIDSQSTMRCE
jgi:Flp pilus assembly protein TadG